MSDATGQECHGAVTFRKRSPDSPPTPSSGAIRTQAWRDRLRHRRRQVKIEIGETTIDALVREGFIEDAATLDDQAIARAIERKLNATKIRRFT
jgi:hypothetical protein